MSNNAIANTSQIETYFDELGVYLAMLANARNAAVPSTSIECRSWRFYVSAKTEAYPGGMTVLQYDPQDACARLEQDTQRHAFARKVFREEYRLRVRADAQGKCLVDRKTSHELAKSIIERLRGIPEQFRIE